MSRRIAPTKSLNPKLSICIATYNRGEFIGETLESIIPQLTAQVELIVVDGASTDNTREIVERYAATCRRVRYVRLPQKGGVDRDYCRSVEIAESEYVWLFSDDDLFEPGAVRRVLAEIGVGYSLIIVNAKVLDSDLSTTLAPAMLEDCADGIFTMEESDGLFERIVPYVSFIGCIVINRKLWQQREKEKYIGTEFVHVGVVFQAPLPGIAKVIGHPLVAIRYGNAQWTGRASGIWLWKWPNLLASFDHISDDTRRRKTDLLSWGEFKKMIVYRALSSYSYATFRDFFMKSALPVWWKACSLAVALLPSSILKVGVRWYLKTFRWHVKEARMTIHDLSKIRNDDRKRVMPGESR